MARPPGPPAAVPPPVTILVPGVSWYRDGRGDLYCLPTETAVPAAAALQAMVSPGRYALLRLPSGTLEVSPARLPLEPVPMGTVFPLRSADIPWQPERPAHGAVDLSQEWRWLFRTRDAFVPWGEPDAAHAAAWTGYGRTHQPRATFRAGADRRHLRYIYPQLVPPVASYRLGAGFARIGDRGRFSAVVTEGDLSLRGPAGWTATAGTDALGWRLALRGPDETVETARRVEDAERLLQSRADTWILTAPSAAARLVLAGPR